MADVSDDGELLSFARNTMHILASITLGDDGLPSEISEAFEAHQGYHSANGLRRRLVGYDGPQATALRTVCTVFLDMVGAHLDGRRHPGWGPRWLAALALVSATDLLPAGPVEVSTVGPDEVLALDDPYVQEMANRDPELAAAIAEERADPWPWP